MTLYHADITVPAGTPQNNPVTKTLIIEDEIVTKIAVTFPWGCNGLVYLSIHYGKYQLFPKPEGEALHDSGTKVIASVYWETPEGRTPLIIKAWAPETQYDHTLMVDIEAVPKEIGTPQTVLGKLANTLQKLIWG